MKPREPLKLRYPSAPVPFWVLEAFESGGMSIERLVIHLALYRRANWQLLQRRKPQRGLRLVSLAHATRRDDDRGALDALRRLLNEMRKDGELDYTTTGTGRDTRYLFDLFPDGPQPPEPRSGVVPGSERLHDAAPEDAPSAAVPGSRLSIPGSELPSNAHQKRTSASSASVSVPGSPDIRLNPKYSFEEEVASRTHAREEVFADTRTRGAYWEPNS